MDIVFYVIWCEKERLNRMINQFYKMNFPYKIVFFEGTNPELSKDWIDKDSKYSSPILQSCTRSHILALADFYMNHRDKKYVCVIEDDVCFLKDNFSKKLEEIISIYEKNKDIEYISLAYLPWISKNNISEPINDNLPKFKKDDSVYYDFSNVTFTVWGAQMYIIQRDYVKKALNILYKPSSKEVIDSVEKFTEMKGLYQNKFLYMTPDSLLPLVLKQGFCFPMLGIEGFIDSTIDDKYNTDKRFKLWKKMDFLKVLKLDDYYTF